MKPAKRALLIFLRYPEAGRVKTRLAADIGPAEAARVYEKLARRTLGVAAAFHRQHRDVDLFLFYTPPGKQSRLTAAFPGPWRFVSQEGDHLGTRMGCAIQQMLTQGYSHVLLVGTDLADLEPSDFDDAFQAVAQGFAALGPAADGGFYLIGLGRPCPPAFLPETWGTPHVFERTEQLLLNSGFQIRRLAERIDIDRRDDLAQLREQAWFDATLSIIIPTIHPLVKLAPLVRHLRHQLWPGDEIIIIEAAKDDVFPLLEGNPRPLALAPPILWATAPRGRGAQLNRGVELARGNLLFFLHDDCLPPPNFAYIIRGLCSPSEISLGCFSLAFFPSPALLAGIARWANLRTRLFGLPYGDQGLFCRREVFAKAGGFKKSYLMEDVDFVRSCRPFGRLAISPERILTSPERYLRKGILRASLQNHLTLLLYHLGVSDSTLYSFYYRNTPNTALRDSPRAT